MRLSKGAEDLLPEILVDYNTSGLNRTVNGSVADTETDAWWRSGCSVRVPGLCEPHHADIIGAENLSFWTYLFARSLLNGALNAAFALFEGATLSLLKEHGGDYGLQRLIHSSRSLLNHIKFFSRFYFFLAFKKVICLFIH